MRTDKIGYDIFTNVGNTHIKPTIGKYDETRHILSSGKKYKWHMARTHAAATNGENTNIKFIEA